jgi:hypothetical protein
MTERATPAGDESTAEQGQSESEGQQGSEPYQSDQLPATKPRRNGPNALDLESAWDY